MTPPGPPRLSIIIVTYNSSSEIHGCLASLIEHPPVIDHEIVVIDNASADGTADAVRQRWPTVRVFDAGRNAGFAAANNLGIDHSSAPLILLLNPDTLVSAGAIDTLVAALDARPDAGIAGPRLVDAAGLAELSFGSMISPVNELRQKLLVRGSELGFPLARAYVQRATHRLREVDWVSGASLLVRREDAERAGGLDERYFMYAEDVDFCAAVRAHGRKVLFVPAAEIVHLRGRSRASATAATARAYRLSQIAFYDKHHPRWSALLRLYLRLLGRFPDSSAERGASRDTSRGR